MRVAIVHNFYRSAFPSGENNVVREDIDALRSRGVDVVEWTRSSDSLVQGSSYHRLPGLLRAAIGPLYSSLGGRTFRKFLVDHKPDIVHLHNVYPNFSPLVISTAHGQGIPVVHTLHNYRRECVKGTFYRDGDVCTACAGKKVPLPAIQHSCYRDSKVQSVVMALSQMIYQRLWRKVDLNVVLTDFQHRWLRRQGIESSQIAVIPNSADNDSRTMPIDLRPSTSVCYVGRLEEQKGITDLIDCWEQSDLQVFGWKLIIAGEGPLQAYVRAKALSNPSIDYRGSLEAEKVSELMWRSAVVAVPSRCYEGFPKVIVEAFRNARPVLVADNPNLASLVTGSGWSAAVGPEMVRVLNRFQTEGEEISQLGRIARGKFESTLQKSESLNTMLQRYAELSCK